MDVASCLLGDLLRIVCLLHRFMAFFPQGKCFFLPIGGDFWQIPLFRNITMQCRCQVYPDKKLGGGVYPLIGHPAHISRVRP